MTRHPHAQRPARARVWVPLVLAVLTGLLAMHGLGPGPGLPRGHTASVSSPAPMAAARAPMAAGSPAGGAHACHEGAHGSGHDGAYGHKGGHGGGHVAHADSTCAASGVSGGPAMDAPALDVTSGPAPDVAPRGGADATTATERAPPSLSQLQLLRI